MSENWERWENEVVNGVFPLRRSVRTSGHSAVFLTDFKPQTNGSALLINQRWGQPSRAAHSPRAARWPSLRKVT